MFNSSWLLYFVLVTRNNADALIPHVTLRKSTRSIYLLHQQYFFDLYLHIVQSVWYLLYPETGCFNTSNYFLLYIYILLITTDISCDEWHLVYIIAGKSNVFTYFMWHVTLFCWGLFGDYLCIKFFNVSKL